MTDQPGSPHKLHRLAPADWAIAGAILVFWLAIYIRTLAPSLLLGDSAEFQTLAVTLGMTHPTGYPVYLLLGKLFTLLPVGTIPARVNLLSAVCGALALGLLYLLVIVLAGRRLAQLFGHLDHRSSVWAHRSMAPRPRRRYDE